MTRWLVIGAGLFVLAGCGKSEQAVGANSPNSITTTAVGNVVATIPSPTPTPDNAVSAATGDNMAADGAMSNDTSAINAM